MDINSGNRVMIVTGGSRGIGAAVCRLAAGDGYHVVVNFIHSREAAEKVVERIEGDGGTARAIAADVSSEEAVIGLFAAARQMGSISVLVNNAGILETQMPLVEMTPDRIDRVFATNFRGTFLCAREAVRVMSTSRGGAGGAIVNVSSAAARLGAPNEYIDYAATKGAVDTLTLGLAKEVGPEGIRVNAVRPGFIDTEMHASGGEPDRVARMAKTNPMGRGGNAEEVARAILWLASDEASYCNGSLLDIAGGR